MITNAEDSQARVLVRERRPRLQPLQRKKVAGWSDQDLFQVKGGDEEIESLSCHFTRSVARAALVDVGDFFFYPLHAKRGVNT